ncbi:MAG: hypothetical protein F6K21_17785 [Symploca sp. SIO2D2]|nr:hypothetical protein [Symploca sp. SIO2D2]
MNTKLKNLLKSDKVHSLADSALNSIFRMASGIVLARLAGAETFASYLLFVTAQMTVMSLVSTLTDTPLLNVASGQKPTERDALIQWNAKRSFRIRMKIAGFAIGLTPLIHLLQLDMYLYAGFAASTIAAISAQFQRARLQALFQMKRALFADATAIAVVCLCTILGWAYLKDASLGYWWGCSLGFFAAAQIMGFRSLSHNTSNPSSELTESITRNGYVMLKGSLANAACSRLHPYLIQIVSSSLAVASYGAAWTVLGPIRLATVALTNLLRPRLAAFRGRGDHQAFALLLRQSRFLILSVGLCLGLFFVLLGESIISFVFGSQIQASSLLLTFAIAYATLDAYTTTQMIQLQIQNKEGSRLTTRYRILAAVASVSLVIPCLFFFGLSGAFASLLIAEAAYATFAQNALREKPKCEPLVHSMQANANT